MPRDALITKIERAGLAERSSALEKQATNAGRPSNDSRRALRRLISPAPMACRRQRSAGWLRPALSEQARSAREDVTRSHRR